MDLNTQQLNRLRGLAHDLKPIVMVGRKGVERPVVEAVKQALLDHELIKVRLTEPKDKKEMAESLATQTDSALCCLIGHTVVLYKQHPDKPTIKV